MRKRMWRLLCMTLCVLLLFGCVGTLFGCDKDTEKPPVEQGGGEKPDPNPGTNPDPEPDPEPEPEPDPEPEPELTYQTVLKDPNFEKGFGVKGQKDGFSTVYGYLRPEGYTGSATLRADWSVAQWYSGYYHMADGKTYPESYDILKAPRTVSGTRASWTDESKTFAIDSESGEIYMELNASQEYTAPRADGKPWPHLLIEYKLEETRLSKIDGLQIALDYRIDKMEKKMSDQEYNSGLHAAQFVFYIVVKNRNENSADNGKYIWFGLNLFDNRNTALTDDWSGADSGSDDKLGTGALMYSFGSKNYLDALPEVGKDISIKVDVYSAIQRAFDVAVKNGYLPNSKWSDMYVTDGNCGFELPGTFDIAATIGKFEINSGMAA